MHAGLLIGDQLSTCMITVMYKHQDIEISIGIWLSGKTLDCRPRDCEFDPPSLQLKIIKRDMYWFFPGKMLPCSALHWARKRTWFVMCGGRSCILHYGPLIETNYLNAPTPNGQSPSASLNKSNTPHTHDMAIGGQLNKVILCISTSSQHLRLIGT